MEKFKRVWRREGESEESYINRLEEAYDEMLESEEGKKIIEQFAQNVSNAQKELQSNEKKIIELTNVENQGWDCLICCKNDATTEFAINRPNYGDSVITFRVCNECLEKMKEDIEARQ